MPTLGPPWLYYSPRVTNDNSPELTWGVVSAFLELWWGKDEPDPGDPTTTHDRSLWENEAATDAPS